MKQMIKYQFILFFISIISLPHSTSAQTAEVVKVDGDMLVITIDNRSGDEYKNLMLFFGLDADSLYRYGNIGQLAKEGWTLLKVDKHVALIGRPLKEDAEKIKWGSQPLYFEDYSEIPGTPGYPGQVDYGVNNFKSSPTVFETEKDETFFLLPGFLTASTVFLSGNFNNWSTSALPMQKSEAGWIVKVKLKPGKYFYKYIVDGQWIYDSNNKLKEYDGYGDYNSTYYHPNFTFNLAGYSNAKKVFVTGSFNGWNEKELQMNKTGSGWELNMYLREGTHAYKFIVDGEWVLDPENKVVRPDGMGHFNSFMAIGDTTYFTLNGFTDARLVILSGTFNAWNTAELEMQKTETGWKLPYVLQPGNFEYKFIVDGKWITDPENPFSIGRDETMNSLKIHEPNFIFHLNRFPEAKEVLITGNFNNWADPGYKLQKTETGWEIPLYLSAGKYIYKYVVDGEWILDPDNPLVEENQFGTGNSVLWIEPGAEFLNK